MGIFGYGYIDTYVIYAFMLFVTVNFLGYLSLR